MRFGKFHFARHVAPKMRLEGAILSILTPMFISYLMAQSGYFLKISSQDFMWLGHMTGFLSLMGYLMISFFKRCAHISESLFEKKKKSKEELIESKLSEFKNRSTLYQIWKSVKVLDSFISFVWPMFFSFWYVDTYLRKTFKDDPFEVSMYSLILRKI